MSVTMTKSDGVTILTMKSDPQSCWPPVCQILMNLCYSPVCCSVSQDLRTVQRSCLSVLGTMQLMVGLLNIGLGLILSEIFSHSYWIYFYAFPFWLGALFIVFGITCILSERFSSPCLVILNVILNLVGVGFAITGIVLYSLNIYEMYLWGDCSEFDFFYKDRPRWEVEPPPSPENTYIKHRCRESKELVFMLLRSINAVLIVLAVLELCVVISSAVLGIKALRSTEKEPEKLLKTQNSKALMEEVAPKPAA